MARRRDEHGAAAVFVGMIMVLLVGTAALVVDLGTQRVARADMQSLADVVALDLARELDGRTAGEIGSLQALAEESLGRNSSTLGDAVLGAPELLVVDPATGGATVAGPDDVPNAVRVRASTSVGFAFGLAESGSATRSATAFASPHACLKLGSSALRVDDLLGSGVSLSAADHQGLAAAEVVLADLAAHLSAGTVAELLGTQVTLGGFYLAVADALDDNGESSAASILRASVLGAMSAAATVEPVVVGDLLALGSGGGAALAATVDALSLATAAAHVADGVNGIAVDTGNPLVTARLRITELPRIACGGATAETAQLRLEVRSEVPLLPVALVSSLSVAHASGSIAAVECTDGEATSLDVSMAAPALAVLSVELDSDFGDLEIAGTEPAPGSAGSYAVALPAHYDTAYETPSGAGTLGIPHVAATDFPLVTRPPALAIASINAALDALASTVTGLADTLGLRLASADIYGVRTAECLNPSLVG